MVEIPLIFGAILLAIITIAKDGLNHWWGYLLLAISAGLAILWFFV